MKSDTKAVDFQLQIEDNHEPITKRSSLSTLVSIDSDKDFFGEESVKRTRLASSNNEDSEETKSSDLSIPLVIIRKEIEQTELPDVKERINPDEFLLRLTKSLYGVSLEVKPAF